MEIGCAIERACVEIRLTITEAFSEFIWFVEPHRRFEDQVVYDNPPERLCNDLRGRIPYIARTILLNARIEPHPRQVHYLPIREVAAVVSQIVQRAIPAQDPGCL